MSFTATTQGIVVTAEPHYQTRYSRPKDDHYVFSYHIRIENQSPYTVKLMRRHWIIFDGVGIRKEVKGEGVIGEQPILEPGASHYYTSWCPLESEIGFMEGWYFMERQEDGIEIEVNIPRFELIALQRLN